MLYANYTEDRMWNVSPRHMCWNTCLSPSGTVWESWGNYRSLGGRPWVALVPLYFLFNLGILTVGIVWLVLLAPSCCCVFRCYYGTSPLNCEPAYSISPWVALVTLFYHSNRNQDKHSKPDIEVHEACREFIWKDMQRITQRERSTHIWCVSQDSVEEQNLWDESVCIKECVSSA